MTGEDGDEVSTMGWRQCGRHLRCNGLYLGVIVSWLFSKLARKSEGALKHERAELRWKLWLRKKAILKGEPMQVMLMVGERVHTVQVLRSGAWRLHFGLRFGLRLPALYIWSGAPGMIMTTVWARARHGDMT